MILKKDDSASACLEDHVTMREAAYVVGERGTSKIRFPTGVRQSLEFFPSHEKYQRLETEQLYLILSHVPEILFFSSPVLLDIPNHVYLKPFYTFLIGLTAFLARENNGCIILFLVLISITNNSFLYSISPENSLHGLESEIFKKCKNCTISANQH